MHTYSNSNHIWKNHLLVHITPWSPSPYIAFSFIYTLGKSFGNVVSIHWWDQINIDTSITMGYYHYNNPWYPIFHGLDYVCDFCSQDFHMYMTILHSGEVYFSIFTISMHFVIKLSFSLHILCNICTNIYHILISSKFTWRTYFSSRLS